jgi:farnesyl diphosphate synthase
LTGHEENSFEARLASLGREIETALAALLDQHSAEKDETGVPQRLAAAMRHATLGGGKRLRPFLLIETARLLGSTGKGPLVAGCALELLHCYSLVHDDLPAMDDDDMRRGRPSVHKAFDEATAILAGDALLTLGFEVLASIEADAEIRVAVVASLARAAGASGMVGGQMLDLAAEGRFGRGEPLLVEKHIRRLQAMKTGALIAFAVEAGAILGRAAVRERSCLRAYGEALGAAFQIGDDILDVEATSMTLGKATGKDAARGKATLVAALGLERAKLERDALATRAVEALSGFDGRADLLRAAARFTVERRM